MNSSKLIANLSRFRLITFDVTDTLIRAKFLPGHKYAETAAAFGYPNIDADALTRQFRVEFKRMAKLYPNFGSGTEDMNWKDWWRVLLYSTFINADTKIPAEDLTSITNTLICQYRTAECWDKCEGTDEIVECMKNLGKTVGIISNYDPSLHAIVRRMNLPKFDFVLTSYEQQVLKPHPKIFNAALERASVEKDEALHIGNTLDIDYLGALNAGWCSVHITNDTERWTEQADVNVQHVYPTLRCFLERLENDEIKW